MRSGTLLRSKIPKENIFICIRRKLHAGADCGRFPVKPKNSLGGKIPTENHQNPAWRVAEVMRSCYFLHGCLF
jgi:hypothetical protein